MRNIHNRYILLSGTNEEFGRSSIAKCLARELPNSIDQQTIRYFRIWKGYFAIRCYNRDYPVLLKFLKLAGAKDGFCTVVTSGSVKKLREFVAASEKRRQHRPLD